MLREWSQTNTQSFVVVGGSGKHKTVTQNWLRKLTEKLTEKLAEKLTEKTDREN